MSCRLAILTDCANCNRGEATETLLTQQPKVADRFSGYLLLIVAFGSTPEPARGIAMFATLILVMQGMPGYRFFRSPNWVQTVTMFMPMRWAVDGFDAVTWRGLSMDAPGMSMAVQLGFAAWFGTLTLWRFKRVAH